MVRNVIFLVFIICFRFSFAQEDGRFEEFFEDGQLKTEGQYKNKQKDGEWKSYHSNGQLARIYRFSDGKRDQEYTAFFSDGKISSEAKKINNEFILKGYYESGSLFFERIIDDGFYKEYLESGELKVESNYVDGWLSGTWKQFYDSGGLQWTVDYKNDYRDGDYQSYYANGQLKLEGKMRKNKKHGAEKRYLENGQLVWSGNYKEDKFHKSWTQYDVFGKVIEELKFDNGKALNADSNTLLAPTMVPDGALEKVPVYPGCEDEYSNRGRRKCLSDKMSQFIYANFDTNLISGLGLNPGERVRISVTFKISENGEVLDIQARGPHSTLEREAIRVIHILPKMQPGIQRNKPVVVPYSVPIVLGIQQDKPKKSRF